MTVGTILIANTKHDDYDIEGIKVKAFGELATRVKNMKPQIVYAEGNLKLRDYTNKEGKTFPIQELIDLKLYSSLDTARRGFKTAAREIASFLIEASITDRKGKNSITGVGYIPLFTGVYYYKNACYYSRYGI